MKIKINQEIKNIEGKQILRDANKPLTLKDVCVNCILSPTEGDDEKKKWDKYEIYKKLRDAKDEVTLTAEEVTVIKKAIGRFEPPLILGQCFEALEK